MYSTPRWSKDVILVLISGIYLKQLFSHSYLITWLNNLIIVIIMIVEKTFINVVVSSLRKGTIVVGQN